MTQIVIIGSGNLGISVADTLRRTGAFNVIGFLDADPAKAGADVIGLPVIGGDERMPNLCRDGVMKAAIAVGAPAAREAATNTARAAGLEFPTIIDPGAHVSELATISEGSCIMMGAAISPMSALGAFVNIGVGTTVIHHASVGDYSVIGGGSTIGARAIVGKGVSLGVGTVIATSDSLRIGDTASTAAGAAVLNDVAAGHFVVGNPARTVRIREPKPSSELTIKRVAEHTPAGILTIVGDALEVNPDSLSPDVKLDQIPEWDSLSILRLLSALEEKFAVTLEDDAVAACQSVADLTNLISRLTTPVGSEPGSPA